MKIVIWLKESSQAIKHDGIVNSYQKGDLYCVYDGTLVYKYPIANIFRIIETYEKDKANS